MNGIYLFLREILTLIGLFGLSHAAYAQKTNDNVTTQSSDAFGRQVGMDRSGLYSGEDVRGFNPVDAGNARVQGLYFDQIERFTQRIVDGSAVHVGISAQHYPFPAPTGLVDYAMTKPEAEPSLSVEIESGQWFGYGGSIEGKLPLMGEKLGISGGVGGKRFVRPEGGESQFRNFGMTILARPYDGAEVLMYGGKISNRSEEARATLFPAGNFVPPSPTRRVFLGQPWTGRDTDSVNVGMLLRLPVGGMRIEAGLFQSKREHYAIFADILSGVLPDGSVTSRKIVADGGNVDQSVSGELRLVREWRAGEWTHSVTASLRGRHKQRLFGGAVTIPLGASSALIPDFRTKPAYVIGDKNHDDVRQMTYGAAYSGIWAGRLSVDLGLSKTNYHKALDFAAPTLVDVDVRDAPLLWNAGFSVPLGKRLTAYAGISRGMEEALIAPDIASNRSEAPPAIRIRQEEAGLRAALTEKLTLVAGVFRIAKPYYNLDPALRYRQLGTITNSGLELSLAGQLAKGVTLVGGVVFLDPKISGEAVDSGLIGQRPVGQLRRRAVANVDWRLGGGKGAWSFDLAVESVSSRVANAANTLAAPPRSTFNLGARYRFSVGHVKLLLRPRIENIFNIYGWNVSSSGGWTYSNPRAVSLQMIADF